MSKLLQNFCRILQNFAEFYRILQKFVDFEKCWKMLKNPMLDAKIYDNFAKIWRNFDKMLTKFCNSEGVEDLDLEGRAAGGEVALHRRREPPRRGPEPAGPAQQKRPYFAAARGARGARSPRHQNFVKISSNFEKILINFCIRCSIFQHFSKSINLNYFYKFL